MELSDLAPIESKADMGGSLTSTGLNNTAAFGEALLNDRREEAERFWQASPERLHSLARWHADDLIAITPR